MDEYEADCGLGKRVTPLSPPALKVTECVYIPTGITAHSCRLRPAEPVLCFVFFFLSSVTVNFFRTRCFF